MLTNSQNYSEKISLQVFSFQLLTWFQANQETFLILRRFTCHIGCHQSRPEAAYTDKFAKMMQQSYMI
jgi:hypothetical protein